VRPTKGGLLSGVVTLVLLALSPATSWATYPGGNGRIAYTCSGICTILPNGSGIENPTDSGHSASWSANGQRLVFVRAGDVFTMSADGGSQTQVTNTSGSEGSPQFSPSGRWIVYSKEVGGYDTPLTHSLWRVRANGADQPRLVRRYVASQVYSPSVVYSPSGRRIAFAGRPRGRAKDGIWKVRPDGSQLSRLTNPAQHGKYVNDYLEDWRPDGERILFYRCEWGIHECDGGNWVMRRDGSREHPVNRPSGDVYSPNGNRFAFASGDYDLVAHSYNCLDIYTMRLDGSDRRELTHNCDDFNTGGPGGYASGPDWQPIPQP
jgi:Tol biopolymer transport system component